MWYADGVLWVNVWAGSHPRSAVKRIEEKENLSRASFSLYYCLSPHSIRVSSALYSSSLCIFHIGPAFMFYVRQLRGEQLCGRCILWKLRERTHFTGRSGAECQTQPGRRLARQQHTTWIPSCTLDTNRNNGKQWLPEQLLHYHNVITLS